VKDGKLIAAAEEEIQTAFCNIQLLSTGDMKSPILIGVPVAKLRRLAGAEWSTKRYLNIELVQAQQMT
jgi:hypothetical protein